MGHLNAVTGAQWAKSRVRRAGAIVVGLLGLSVGLQAQQATTQIRSGTVLVPVDVRVLDANGNPVTDLTAADFTVYENDVRQDIAHFIPASFATGVAGEVGDQLTVEHPLAAAANPHRTFIIVLGRGRLNGPVKGIESLIAFIRERLLATDRIGLVAYLRAAMPSADHAGVARFLEQYRDRHEDIEGRIRADFDRALGLVTLSRDTRERINAVFHADGIPPFVSLPGGTGTAASRYLTATYLRRTIEIARHIPGEKQVIVLSEDRLGISRRDHSPDDHLLVRWANQARVALSYINTAGLSGQTMIRGQLSIPTKSYLNPRDGSLIGVSDVDFFAPADHRVLTSHTGGIASFYRYASDPLTMLDRSSRFQYLLGYYPKAATAPDTYRVIRIVIRRPSVTAQYRHGYQFASSPAEEQAFRQAAAEDALQRALDRLTGAEPPSRFYANQVRAPYLKVTISPPHAAGELSVDLAFDPMRVAFSASDTGHRATLHLALLVNDKDRQPVGELAKTVEIVLTPDEYAQAKKQWLLLRQSVPIRGRGARVLAAVYDYDSDRTLTGASNVPR